MIIRTALAVVALLLPFPTVMQRGRGRAADFLHADQNRPQANDN